MTQCEILLSLCQQGWTSPLDLFRESGSMRMSGRIYDLKRDGYEFEERNCSRIGKLGNKVTWKEFRLKRPEPAEVQTSLF